MALITNSDQLGVAFTPASASDFIVQVSGGEVILQRRNTSTASFVNAVNLANQAYIISNPVAGADYMWVKVSGSPVCRADQ